MITNKERYKRAFSGLHSSQDTLTEVINMLNEQGRYKRKRSISRATAACLAAVLLVVCASFSVYAANVGGIQRAIQIWVCGDQTDAVIEFDGQGNYSLEYTDEDGNKHLRGGGGIAYEGPFGGERPLTEEELLEDLNAPDIREENGVWTVYYYGQSHDITDKFDEDGVCYITLIQNNGEELYLTVTKEHGYAASSICYVDAKEMLD